MQKVVGSSPIIRSSESPAHAGFFLWPARDRSRGEDQMKYPMTIPTAKARRISRMIQSSQPPPGQGFPPLGKPGSSGEAGTWDGSTPSPSI